MLASREFRLTLDQGRKAVCPKIVLYGRKRSEEEKIAGLRFGLIVSKKVGNAVVRNRVKRGLRESFRHMNAAMDHTPDVDLVVIARNDAGACDAHELFRALEHCYARLARP